MDLYEYQGKQLFARVGIPVSEGRVALTPAEAQAAAAELGGPVVVKAQVLTGGRGKAGGIKLATTPAEAAERAAEILGLDIRGHVVRTLWIERASEIEREYYFSPATRTRSPACTSTRSPAGIRGSRASSASARTSRPASASR
jgi:succinyl-CoA synthetase beta subunit